jgi:hypothetical protein
VRGPKHVVRCGQTPVLAEEQAPCPVDIIDTSTRTIVGMRDRAH